MLGLKFRVQPPLSRLPSSLPPLGPVRPQAALPDRALHLPTFSHLLIVNKLPSSVFDFGRELPCLTLATFKRRKAMLRFFVNMLRAQREERKCTKNSVPSG